MFFGQKKKNIYCWSDKSFIVFKKKIQKLVCMQEYKRVDIKCFLLYEYIYAVNRKRSGFEGARILVFKSMLCAGF